MAIWIGDAPAHCDNCHKEITDSFYDAALPIFFGSWGNVCPKCFILAGGTLGIGRGQHYKKEGSKFVCVAGGREPRSRSGQ